MPHRERKNIHLGLNVAIVLKQDQRTGKQTIGVVKDLLTNSAFHPHGIKVRLMDGEVGRIQQILFDAGISLAYGRLCYTCNSDPFSSLAEV